MTNSWDAVDDRPTDLTTDFQAATLALNNAHVAELSWLGERRLKGLLRQAFYARRIGNLKAFLLALDERAVDYDSPNYLWFRSRYSRFVYIDRVVVAGYARGKGYARQLYAELFEQALAASHKSVVCEVNSDPPNAASDAFHASRGFVEGGAAVIHGGAKTVRYLALPLARRGSSTSSVLP